MNLAIKYRPKRFDDIYGHDSIIKDLYNRSKNNNFPKVLFLSGYTGLGKTTLARIIAKSILCENKDEEGNICNKCDVCETIDEGKINSFYFEYNASNLNIDEVRDIDSLSRQRGFGKIKTKIFVIDELQEMSKSQSAQKNLLKVLESENPDAYFILGAMDEGKVPTAIKNRAVPYKLHPLPISEIANYLMEICLNENKDVSDKEDILITIASNCNQSMRTAVSYLERVIYSDLWDVKLLMSELDLVHGDTVKDTMKKLFTADKDFMSSNIPEATINNIRYRMNLIYKHKLGVNLNKWEQEQINGTGFVNIDIKVVEDIIKELNSLQSYVYIIPSLTESILLNCYRIVLLSKQIDEPAMRRRKPNVS